MVSSYPVTFDVDYPARPLNRLTTVTAYLALLDDPYPSTDEDQAVHLDFPYPDAHLLNRWLPLVKWLLAIPRYVNQYPPFRLN